MGRQITVLTNLHLKQKQYIKIDINVSYDVSFFVILFLKNITILQLLKVHKVTILWFCPQKEIFLTLWSFLLMCHIYSNLCVSLLPLHQCLLSFFITFFLRFFQPHIWQYLLFFMICICFVVFDGDFCIAPMCDLSVN